ncbi:hypothetical protein NDU88_003843 [Pleurodeles waltl]|uniref:Uncharacterized protein n=1 Tax=Pleurodeles waltl TaxID=8319 RepID=A0AAV7MVS0_PLEWA|nr:hypothetical protein NDU88_003843 [Pleurodeles waltl]
MSTFDGATQTKGVCVAEQPGTASVDLSTVLTTYIPSLDEQPSSVPGPSGLVSPSHSPSLGTVPGPKMLPIYPLFYTFGTKGSLREEVSIGGGQATPQAANEPSVNPTVPCLESPSASPENLVASLVQHRAANIFSEEGDKPVSAFISSQKHLFPMGPMPQPQVAEFLPFKVILQQILSEIQEMKIPHAKAHLETQGQLGQINVNIQLLTSQVVQLEQRVSDLEDFKSTKDSFTLRLYPELTELRLKLGDVENRSEHSNLCFVGILEDQESGQSVTSLISDLIVKHVITEEVAKELDLTITNAHHLLPLQPCNSKY